MVFSLAPKANSKFSPNSKSTTVRTIETITCKRKHPPSVCSALSISPFPIEIEARGAPPELTSPANADTIIIIGIVTPTPVRARLPASGI